MGMRYHSDPFTSPNLYFPMLKFLQTAVAVALTAMSITVAPFSAMLGLMGFAGRLLDTSRSENTQAGALFLGTAVLIWIASVAWYVMGCFAPLNRRVPFCRRFSVRTLLITMTIVAVVLGLIVLPLASFHQHLIEHHRISPTATLLLELWTQKTRNLRARGATSYSPA